MIHDPWLWCRLLLSVSCLPALVFCGSRSTKECEPGEARSCPCLYSAPGGQPCQPSGWWGDCLGCPVSPAAVSATAGMQHTCLLLDDGTAICGGSNSDGQLGNGDTNTTDPTRVADLEGISSISAGYFHTCATLADGTAWCWGEDDAGQLGDGSPPHEDCWLSPCSPIPVQVVSLSDAVAVTAGMAHSCALVADGTVRCWGTNFLGQLGDGSDTHESCFLSDCSPVPITVLDLTDAVHLSSAYDHACAVRAGGEVACWGSNFFGQLGDGTFDHSNVPIAVSEVTEAVAVAAGWNHTCVVTADGRVLCWGSNEHGQLGDGTNEDRYSPTTVMGLGAVVSVTADFGRTCAVLSDGSVSCWGVGWLGDATEEGSSTPRQVCALGDVVEVAMRGHICAVHSTGAVSCWGCDRHGEFGLEHRDRCTEVPVNAIFY